ncbi:hypothetical protein M2T79_15895 [Elizabethkingia miricola]|uniref:hypothetical protein n=1 Tax=Elizabethkingia miricola TaxID=172045 RepID=UPI002018A6A5|nr:hypothetical protein [Elizabethkingia miricola]MCL1658086.1 hypothetical protein [Elizabethkingia miricola]
MTTTEKADKVLQMIVHVEMTILSLKSDLINGSMFFSKEEIEQRIEWRIKKKQRLFGYYKYVLR